MIYHIAHNLYQEQSCLFLCVIQKERQLWEEIYLTLTPFIIFYSDCDDGGKPSSGPVYDQGARTARDGTLQDN